MKQEILGGSPEAKVEIVWKKSKSEDDEEEVKEDKRFPPKMG